MRLLLTFSEKAGSKRLQPSTGPVSGSAFGNGPSAFGFRAQRLFVRMRAVGGCLPQRITGIWHWRQCS